MRSDERRQQPRHTRAYESPDFWGHAGQFWANERHSEYCNVSTTSRRAATRFRELTHDYAHEGICHDSATEARFSGLPARGKVGNFSRFITESTVKNEISRTWKVCLLP